MAFRSHLLQVANMMIMQTSINYIITAFDATSKYSTNDKDHNAQGFEGRSTIAIATNYYWMTSFLE